MTTFHVGPTSLYHTIAAAMLAAGNTDTISLDPGYSNETATVTHTGMTVTGGAASTGIVLQLGVGIPTFTLTGTAPVTVRDASDGNGIVGNAGDNTIIVTNGADAVNGGLGVDRLVVDYHLATGAVTGDSTSSFAEAGGSRLVTITDGTIENFTITTGSGVDTLTTGAGNDIIHTGQGASTVTAGQGANVVVGGSDEDTVTTLDGGNLIDGGDGANTLTSGTGNDTISGGLGADSIVAGGGDDLVTIKGGSDTAASGAGTDRLIVDYAALVTSVTGGVTAGSFLGGYAGNFGDGAVNTVSFTGTENFTVTSGTGNDTITVGDGSDVLRGGAGSDHLEGGGGSDVLAGGLGNDILGGGARNDTINGQDGNDTVNGGQGDDDMYGGTGNDLLIVTAATDKVFEFAGGGTDTVQSYINYTLGANVENLTLVTAAAVNGIGNELNNVITANLAGAANNWINGRAGSDTIIGGAGNDSFVFSTALGPVNVDHIVDFNVLNDTIRLDDAIFTGIGAPGTILAAGFFHHGAAAADANDHIIYDATGGLYYDKDGIGGVAQIKFAQIAPGLAITEADFGIF